MNKVELVAEIAKNTDLTKVDAERATEALLKTVAYDLEKRRRSSLGRLWHVQRSAARSNERSQSAHGCGNQDSGFQTAEIQSGQRFERRFKLIDALN